MGRALVRTMLSLSLVVACDDQPEPDFAEPAPRPPMPAFDAMLRISDGGSARAERKPIARVSLPPRPAPAQRVAFARGRLGRLTADELVVHDVRSWKLVTRISLANPRRLVRTADGGFAVADLTKLVRLAPRRTEPETFSRVALFPRSRLFGDERFFDRVWVHHAGDSALYRYDYADDAGPLQGVGNSLDFSGFDGRALGALPDGAFVATEQGKLRRFFPDGKSVGLALPDLETDVWRLVRARRIDRVWVATKSGKMSLVELGQTARRVRKIDLGMVPFELASSVRYVAALGVEPGEKHPTKWRLVVHGHDGQLVFRQELSAEPGTPPPGTSWLAHWVGNRDLAIARDKPLVAVGGATSVEVWDVKKRSRVFLQP